MTQAYSDPDRETDPHALPDIEVFYWTQLEAAQMIDDVDATCGKLAGWYWWACFPGCLPDSEPFGPFETEAEALADARA